MHRLPWEECTTSRLHSKRNLHILHLQTGETRLNLDFLRPPFCYCFFFIYFTHPTCVAQHHLFVRIYILGVFRRNQFQVLFPHNLRKKIMIWIMVHWRHRSCVFFNAFPLYLNTPFGPNQAFTINRSSSDNPQ